MDGTILIADDDRGIRTVLSQALTRAGCRVHATGSLQQLLKWVQEGRGDLVVTDVMMPDGNGIDTIPEIRSMRPELPVIVISAQNSIVTTIRATEAAAFDYLPKPFDLPDLLARSRDALSRRPRKSDPAPAAVEMRQMPAGDAPELPLIGRSDPMQAMFRLVARLLNADLPVVISGGPGSGRTTLARALHEFSTRNDGPLSVLSAVDSDPEAMARRISDARGGTLVIEDPAGFDAAAQTRLRALLDRPEAADARLVATLGPAPEQEVEEGRLLPELYYRLAGASIQVPPLSERRDDIPALAQHLMARLEGQGLTPRELPEPVLQALRGRDFPGNVRELEHLVRRLAVTGSGPVQPEELGAFQTPAQAPASGVATLPQNPESDHLSVAVAEHLRRYFDLHGSALPPSGLYDRILHEIERPLLQISLDATGGNQLRCAELLGINRNTLRKKLTMLNIDVTRRRRVM